MEYLSVRITDKVAYDLPDVLWSYCGTGYNDFQRRIDMVE